MSELSAGEQLHLVHVAFISSVMGEYCLDSPDGHVVWFGADDGMPRVYEYCGSKRPFSVFRGRSFELGYRPIWN